MLLLDITNQQKPEHEGELQINKSGLAAHEQRRSRRETVELARSASSRTLAKEKTNTWKIDV